MNKIISNYSTTDLNSTVPLPSGPESSSHKLIKSILLVSIRHDNSVVLSSHVGLYSLSILTPPLVDVLSLI